MKKVLVFTLLLTMILSMLAVPASALSFSDLAEEHWAYANVQALVEEGTVSGYEDGTFRPNGTVTRAEFVKMIGEGPVMRERDYDDVASNHWAYTYVMKSGMPERTGNLFYPNQAITRGLAAELLWKRNGAEQGVFAPAIITSQYSQNTDAIAWAYATGLMKGDDGINLRAEGTLSRAEAAALIIRARRENPEKQSFASSVSPKIMENVFKALSMFDDNQYDPGKTVTNGELARAALRVGSEEFNLSYAGYAFSTKFEHPYAKEIAVVFETCLGKTDADAAFADKTATFGDAVAALSYQFIAKSHKGLAYGATTDGLPASVTNMMNVCLTFAKKNGIISLHEDLNAPITLQEITAICLQLDQLNGSQTDISTDIHPIAGRNIMKDHALLMTEMPYGDYRAMLKDMPYAVYDTPFVNCKTVPDVCYDFAREYNTIFVGILSAMKQTAKEKTGAEVRFTYYPSLVCATEEGYTMRIKYDIVSLNGEKTIGEVFPVKEGVDASRVLSTGSTGFMDVATGQNFSSIQVSDETVYVEQILR
ncbi:MAG: S-layer homology domain-containing protein [Ruminococcaceae bacterium]|nr:S-layer homology domain-containing protein [Oscillospiraceae bacterium]